ncbi:hypothetical protein Ancab_025767 [Ancistrocladus abbreviatus]
MSYADAVRRPPKRIPTGAIRLIRMERSSKSETWNLNPASLNIPGRKSGPVNCNGKGEYGINGGKEREEIHKVVHSAASLVQIRSVADSVEDVAAGDKANSTDKNPNMGAEQMSSNIKKGSMAAEDPGGINDNNDEELHKFEIIGQFQEKADPIVGLIKYHSSSYDVEEREKQWQDYI